MNMCSWLILVLMCIAMVSCTKNEVDVKFDLPQSVNGNYRLLYYASDPQKGWYTEAVAPVQNGKFEVKCFTRNPTIVFILRDSNEPAAAFYAERGDEILITGDSPDPASWKISGNDLTERWSLWREKNRDALSSRDSKKINAAVESFIKTNAGDPLSPLLLSLYFDRRENRVKFTELWDNLDEKSLDPMIVDLANCSDIIEGGLSAVDNISGIRLHTFGNGSDSLQLSGVRASVLYFWRGDTENRDKCIDMLKKLSKEFPDSAKRNIVDVCFESDSLSWTYPIKKDSLNKAVRAWMPRGINDETAMRMGVERTPYLLVIDSKGKQTYAGDNEDEAEKAFRRLMSK